MVASLMLEQNTNIINGFLLLFPDLRREYPLGEWNINPMSRG